MDPVGEKRTLSTKNDLDHEVGQGKIDIDDEVGQGKNGPCRRAYKSLIRYSLERFSVEGSGYRGLGHGLGRE